MSNQGEEEDNKITPFPKARERRPARNSPRPAEIANDHRPAKGEPILNLPPVVRALCLILLALAVGLKLMPDGKVYEILMTFGVVSARYTGFLPLTAGAYAAPLTHLFLHGGWLHVGVNIGMLMAFGSALERAIGGRRLLALYFLSGLAGALAHVAIYPHLLTPLIGASGAISGLFGGVLVVMHKQGMMGGSGYRRLALFAAVWIGISLFFGFTGMPGATGTIAWTAHVGGFVAGLLLFNRLVPEPVQFR